LCEPIPPPEHGIEWLATNAPAPPKITIEGWAGHVESHEEAIVYAKYRKPREVRGGEWPDGSPRYRTDWEVVDEYVRTVKSVSDRVSNGGGHFLPGEPHLQSPEYERYRHTERQTITEWRHKEEYRALSIRAGSAEPPSLNFPTSWQ
jgi:hypothetical protein